jgi:hypothetical protein
MCNDFCLERAGQTHWWRERLRINVSGALKIEGEENKKTIPRLYSVSELGAIYSWHYQGGGNILECVVLGRVAGQKSAAEKPWSQSYRERFLQTKLFPLQIC